MKRATTNYPRAVAGTTKGSVASPSEAPPHSQRYEKPERREVDETDLARIGVLEALLLTLNDPRASSASLARHVEKLEVLTSRVRDRFVQRTGSDAPALEEQLSLLGNRELERILLAYLEDVVVFHSEATSATADESPASTRGVR